MNESKNPVLMFFGGLAIIGFLEFVLSGTGILFVSAYGIGVLTIGCSVFYGAVKADRRLHTPTGITVSVAGLLVASVVTWHVAARLLSMLRA